MTMYSVEKTVNESAIVISFSGEHVVVSEELENVLDFSQLERSVVILDLSKAKYISSSVLGWIVNLRNILLAQEKSVPVITGCNGKILNLFEVTGVVNLFKFR